MTFTKYMRENCLNIPFIRKALTKARIKQFQKNYCSDSYIEKIVDSKELRDWTTIIISHRDKKEVLQIMSKMDLFVE